VLKQAMVELGFVQPLLVLECFMLAVAVVAHNLCLLDLVLREAVMDAKHQHQFHL
jgi:hypothetical protein